MCSIHKWMNSLFIYFPQFLLFLRHLSFSSQFGRAPINFDSCFFEGSDALSESYSLLFSEINFIKIDPMWEVNQKDLFFFLAPSSLVRFRESFHRISIELLFSEKLFGIASHEFSLEATLGTLPNSTYLFEIILY